MTESPRTGRDVRTAHLRGAGPNSPPVQAPSALPAPSDPSSTSTRTPASTPTPASDPSAPPAPSVRTPHAPGAVPEGKPAHRDGNVLRWLAAYALSMTGDGAFFLALGWAAQRVTSPAGVGVVMAAGAVPRALLLLTGGVFADRYGPRRVMLGSDAVRSVVVLALAAALALAAPGLWPLVVAGLLFGVVDALFLPAVGALPPRLTGHAQLARVQGMSALAIRAGTMAGPPLGGLALGHGGPALAFAVVGGLFAMSLALLTAVRVREAVPPATQATPPTDGADGTDGTDGREGREATCAAGSGPLAGLTAGMRHIRRSPLLTRLLLGCAVSDVALAAPLNVGVVLLAAERGWGPGGVGQLVAAFGLGAGGAALLLAVRGRLPRAGAVQGVALAVASLAMCGLALTGGFGGALLVAFVVGTAGGLSGGVSRALVQTTVDPAYLGRVTSVSNLAALGLGPLAYPVFGSAAGAWGVAPVFAGCGLLALLGSGVVLTSRSVRRAELP